MGEVLGFVLILFNVCICALRATPTTCHMHASVSSMFGFVMQGKQTLTFVSPAGCAYIALLLFSVMFNLDATYKYYIAPTTCLQIKTVCVS